MFSAFDKYEIEGGTYLEYTGRRTTTKYIVGQHYLDNTRGLMYVDKENGTWPSVPNDFRMVEPHYWKDIGAGEGGNHSNWDGKVSKGQVGGNVMNDTYKKRIMFLRNPTTDALTWMFITEDNSRMLRLTATPNSNVKRIEFKDEMMNLQPEPLTTMLLKVNNYGYGLSADQDLASYIQYTALPRSSRDKTRGVSFYDPVNMITVFLNYDLDSPEGPQSVGIETGDISIDEENDPGDGQQFFKPFGNSATGVGMEALNNNTGPEPGEKIPSDKVMEDAGGFFNTRSTLNLKSEPKTLYQGEKIVMKSTISISLPQMGPYVTFPSDEISRLDGEKVKTDLTWSDKSDWGFDTNTDTKNDGGKIEATMVNAKGETVKVWESKYERPSKDITTNIIKGIEIDAKHFEGLTGKVVPITFTITNRLKEGAFDVSERVGKETLLVKNMRQVPIKYMDNFDEEITDLEENITTNVYGLDGDRIVFDVPKKMDEPTFEYLRSEPDQLLVYNADSEKMTIYIDEKFSTEEAIIVYKANYMDLKLSETEKHVYPDQINKDISFKYTLSKIPVDTGDGEIRFTYPKQNEKDSDKIVFETQDIINKSVSGEYFIKPDMLMDNIDYTMGTKPTYDINTRGWYLTPSAYQNMRSRKVPYVFHVYNLGAKPIPQKIKKGESFNKLPKDIIFDQVILPGHSAELEYVKSDGSLTKDPAELDIDTSKETGGNPLILQVKMTDKDEPSRSAIINVPLTIGEIPDKTKLVLSAEDFELEQDRLRKTPPNAINALILEKSKAVAFDPVTGSTEGVKLEVLETNLKTDSKENEVYTAKIKASKKGFDDQIKEIKIHVLSGLKAQSNPQKVPLGKKVQELDLKDFVKDVEVSGKKIDKTQYEVSLLDKIPDVVTEKNTPVSIPVEVRLVGAPVGSGEKVEVPVTVMWGNSIAFGGDEKDGRMGGGAYSLHHNKSDGTTYISAVSGLVNSNDNEVINSLDTEKTLELDVFNVSAATDVYEIKKDNLTPEYRMSALGSYKKQDVLNSWGTDRLKSVQLGDVVRGWSSEADKQYLTSPESEKPTALNDKEKEIYYEITKEGYRRLTFNLLEEGSAKGLIMYGTDKKTLQSQASNGDFIKLKQDNPKVKILGFKDGNYPDTSKPTKVGESTKGTIIIQEVLLTGKKVNYEVEMDFTIVDGGLSFESVDNLTFGTQKLPTRDLYFAPENEKNDVVVKDTRYAPKEWDLQARMDEALKYSEGTKQYELEGSSVVLLDTKGNDKILSKDSQTIFKVKDAKKGINTISWDNKTNTGYRLFVRGGTAKEDKKYRSTITYSIDDKPTTRAVGD
ncbi:WxL domain-containing protein [uncultured Vagococcus sp.]|uniref:WxL domain-containing protein n=1 Tax=uncultured Vagococcus sp. TaxID=189676 RepID=UPI002587506E|nr:WxL domain-containing protein [uncultured Vagococcus sp.]